MQPGDKVRVKSATSVWYNCVGQIKQAWEAKEVLPFDWEVDFGSGEVVAFYEHELEKELPTMYRVDIRVRTATKDTTEHFHYTFLDDALKQIVRMMGWEKYPAAETFGLVLESIPNPLYSHDCRDNRYYDHKPHTGWAIKHRFEKTATGVWEYEESAKLDL